MKKILCILLIYCIIFNFVGCDSSTSKNEEHIRTEKVYHLIFKHTRARVRKDTKTLNKYMPNIIDKKEGKEKYKEKVSSISKYKIKKVGIEYKTYTIVNAGERKKILADLEKKYGINDKYSQEIKEVGYITYDIKYVDNKGKEGRLKAKNVGYKYHNEYYMIVSKEELKGE